MSRRTIFRCDQCGKEIEDYEPDGWRRPYYQSMTVRGGRQLMETKKNTDLCSASCEVLWLYKHVEQPLNDEIKLIEEERQVNKDYQHG